MDFREDSRSAPGYSLPELLAVLGIVAIMAAIAVPGFRRQLAEAGLRTSVQQIQTALHLARQMALTTGNSFTVCPSADGLRCGFGPSQWVLFRNADSGRADRREPGEELVRVWQLPQHVQVSGSRGYANFLPEIRAASTVTFDFCHGLAPSMRRSLIVSQTGRVRVSRPNPASTAAPSGCH